MLWVVLAGIAICSPIAIAAVLRPLDYSTPIEPGRTPRFDVVRSGLAVAAGALGLLTGLTALADYSIESNPYAGWFFVAAGVSAGVLALYPARGAWGRTRRRWANALGSLWMGIGLISIPVFTMASACACGGSGSGSPAPTPFGVDTRSWVWFAVILGPTALLLAGSALADRIYALLRR